MMMLQQGLLIALMVVLIVVRVARYRRRLAEWKARNPQ